ncbi:MAG: hypothetical protein AB7L66_02860 [Gemmatimonadales bacterium]
MHRIPTGPPTRRRRPTFAAGGIAALLVATAGPSPLAGQPASRGLLGYRLRTAMLMDTNLEHDETPDRAWGGVLGMGLEFQSSRTRPVLALRYEVAGHQYSIPAQWNRVSQAGAARLALRPNRRLTLETDAEVTLKGSSEDRDLGNQYLARQTIAWRPWRRTTVEVAAAFRLRRYEDNLDRNGTNRYVRLELGQRLGEAVEVKASWRGERNEADGPRYRYARHTGELELETGLPAGRLTLGGRLRRQEYPERLVEDLPDPTRRLDWRYQGTATWEVWPWRSFGIVMEYQYEGRRSNDPDKAFVAHQVGLSFERVW